MKTFMSLIMALSITSSLYADDRPTIDSLVGREIFIQDGFAGQSMMVVKSKDEFQVIRTFFGSGLPTVGTVTYRAVAAGRYQLRFSEISRVSGPARLSLKNEEFILSISDDNDIRLLLNGLQIVIHVKAS